MKPHQSANDSGGEIDRNWVDVPIAKSFHHWDFLEEIEAPMWADLRSEAESSYRDIDDEWFHISHPFHQCSSQKLRSAVNNSGEEGCKNSRQDPPSPKLPPSVSKSRGKDFKSREWGQKKAAMSKQHPVKTLVSRSSLVSSVSGDGVKRVSRADKSLVNKGSSASSINESGVTEVASQNCSSERSSLVCQHKGSNSTITISEGSSAPQQSKSFQVSNQIPGRTNELLSTLRTNLRRSCATRQASRVEVNGGRKSEGCKSSSSKSSVGSSSHTSFDGTKPGAVEIQNKEKTPDSRNVTKVLQAPKIKSKNPMVSKWPAVQVRGASSTLKSGNEIKTLKGKIKANVRDAQKHSLPTKVLVPHKVNGQRHLNARITKVDDKKTASRLVNVNQKIYTDRAGGCMSQLEKPAKKGVVQKSNTIGAKEKIIDRIEAKESKNVAKRVYFR